MSSRPVRIAFAMLVLPACATAGSSDAIDASVGVDAVVRRDSGIDAFVDVCPTADTCTGAMMLGTVSGDTGNVKLSAMGYRAAWYRVRVTEDNSGIGGISLRVAAKLTSPTAVDFDVLAYVNTGNDVVECTSTTGTLTTNGLIDQVKVEWGEGSVSNGSSDSRNVSIEIRPKSGQCQPQYPWQLEIEGNWN